MPKRRYSRRKNNAPVEDNTFENETEFDNIGDGPLTKRMRAESEVEAADLFFDDTPCPTVHKETSTTTSKPRTVVLAIRRPSGETAQIDKNNSILIRAEANTVAPAMVVDKPNVRDPAVIVDKPDVRDVSTAPIMNVVRRSLNFAATVSRVRTISSPVTTSDAGNGQQMTERPNTPVVRRPASQAQSTQHAELMARFPEYRALVRELEKEKKKSQQWAEDYAKLRKELQELKESTIPRPPPATLKALSDLVVSFRCPGAIQDDDRSEEELANDLGIQPIDLLTLHDANGLKASMNAFRHLYPNHSSREKLNLAELKKLIQTLHEFGKRCCPGAQYDLSDLQEMIGNSLRQARHQMKNRRKEALAAKMTFEKRSELSTGIEKSIDFGEQPPSSSVVGGEGEESMAGDGNENSGDEYEIEDY